MTKLEHLKYTRAILVDLVEEDFRKQIHIYENILYSKESQNIATLTPINRWDRLNRKWYNCHYKVKRMRQDMRIIEIRINTIEEEISKIVYNF